MMCLHSNMPVITGYIYTHYSSVQREMNPFPFCAAVLPSTAPILRVVKAQTTSTLLGGKTKQSLLRGTQVKNGDWVPFRQQVSYMGIQEPYKQRGRKKTPGGREGAGCRGGNAAHPRLQRWLEKALACLPLALCCRAGVAPPMGTSFLCCSPRES